MKISILVFLSISLSNCFISTSVTRKSRTKLFKQKNSNRFLNSTKSNKENPLNLVSSNNCTTDSRTDSRTDLRTDLKTDSIDLIEKYSDWFGLFPKEQKWKSIRFTFYSISAGYCLSAGIYELFNSFLENPLEDFFQ